MSYNFIKYYHIYYDIQGIYHRIDIYGKTYVGSPTLIETSGDTPVIMRHGGADKNSFESLIIQGQELQFNFFVHNSDVSSFDALFASDYKDYKVKYYVGGYGSEYLEFIGWIDPENLSKEYSTNPPYVEINLSANDGLVSLKDIEFRGSVDEILNIKYNILAILYFALVKTEIELDFMIQLGTYEITGMNGTDCALEKIYVDSRAFIGEMSKSNDGFTTVYGGTGYGGRKRASGQKFTFGTITSMSDPMDCWSVIESVLLDFNVVLKQYKGKYYITNQRELNSYVFYYDWETLTQQSRATTNNILDISDYQYKIGIEQQKVKPLKDVKITFKNKDLGGDITGVDLTNWTLGEVWNSDAGVGYIGGIWGIRPTNGTSHMFVTLVDDFAVTKVTDNDYIKFTFSAFIIEDAPKHNIKILVSIKDPAGNWEPEVDMGICWMYSKYYDSPIVDALKIHSSGNHNIKISFVIPDAGTWTNCRAGLYYVTISKIVDYAEKEEVGLVTYDRYYTQTLNKNLEIFSTETILADSFQVSEIGSYMYYLNDAFHTSQAWNSYGHTEGIKLIDIYARNILNNRYSYKNYLRCTVIDRSHTIGFNNILTIDSKNYAILAYTRNFKLGELTLELIELLTTIRSYTPINETTGETVYGEGGDSRSVSVAASVLHNALGGLQGGGVGPAFYHISTEIYVGLIDTTTFYINSTTHRVGIGTTFPTGKLDVQSPANNDIIAMFGAAASVNSTYPGYIYISNVNTLNSGYNINGNAAFYINYNGYQNGTSQFRDLNICDGKTSTILFVDGSNGAVGIGTPTVLRTDQLSLIGSGSTVKLHIGEFYNASYIFNNYYYAGAHSTDDSTIRSLGIQIDANGISFQHAEASSTPSRLTDMYINYSGNVCIGNMNNTYKLEVTGTGYFSSHLYTGANVGTTTFFSGFAGSGWQLGYAGSDSTLTVDNLVVRKALTAYELDINKINSVNGGIIVSVANGTILTVSGTTFYMDEDSTNKQIQFQVNDYVRAQVWTGRSLASYIGLVTAVNHSATYGSANIVCTTVSGTPWNGMELVQIGNTADTNRQNLIYITASDTNNPYIDMLAGVNQGSFAGKQKLRIGNLTGIIDGDFGGALSGYGLYANNIYLKGKIVVTEGWGFTNIVNPSSWVPGSTGNQSGWLQVGPSTVNSIITEIGAKGSMDVIWKGFSVDGDYYGGGFTTLTTFSVDANKLYRYAVYVKKLVSRTDGVTNMRASIGGVYNLDGTETTTAAFFWGSLPALDKWYLIIGYVYPHTHTDTTSYGGVYDVLTGEKVLPTIDFKWRESPLGSFSASQYGVSVPGTIYFSKPRVELVDGSEPSIESMLNASALINPAANGIFSPPPSGTGLYIDATHMGYYTDSAWKSYIDNEGNMLLGDPLDSTFAQGLYWDQSEGQLVIAGSIGAFSGHIGGWTINADYITKDTGTDATSEGMSPADYPFYAGATYAHRASAPFRVTPAGAVTMTKATIQTGTSGQRVVISSSTNDMYFYTSGTEYIQTGADVYGGFVRAVETGVSQNTFRSWILQIAQLNGSEESKFEARVDGGNGVLKVNMTGLPTSGVGLNAGDVYYDSELGALTLA